MRSQHAEEPLPISKKIDAVKEEVASTCARVDRAFSSVVICGASKTRSSAEIREAYDYGIRDFGENYVQEAAPKIEALADTEIIWHFIGRIQSNKTKQIAESFDWVQTVDRFSIARRLSDARAKSRKKDRPLNICIQVNVDDEGQKAGVNADELPDLIYETVHLPNLRLRGLMAIPKAPEQASDSMNPFIKLKELFNTHAPPEASHWDTLSMGMSGDFKEAIAAGATIIRLGTSIFGPR